MSLRTSLCITFLLAMNVRAMEAVVTEFRVSVPRDTPNHVQLYVAGNVAALGRWSPKGLPLVRGGDGIFRGSAKFVRGMQIEFKITRGTWHTVEKDTDGHEMSNRTFLAGQDDHIEIHVASWHATQRLATITGDVRFHEEFASKFLHNKRTVAVYLPPGYESTDARYPVLYMHDGQNLFDAATSAFGDEWQADETAERLIREEKIRPLIIVGIYNTAQRTREYTAPLGTRHRDAQGDAYCRFVIDEVKSMVDTTYRTHAEREHTAVAGSSLGGVISLYMCARFPDVFSRCGALSTAVGYQGEGLLDCLQQAPPKLNEIRFCVLVGSKEGQSAEASLNFVQGSRDLGAALQSRGLTAEKNYHYLEVEDARHNEAAWAKQLEDVLLYLFGDDG